MPQHFHQEGADEKGNSSSPFCARSCTTPSLDTSIGYATAFPPRRCRRKRQFIGTFLRPPLYDPVPRCLYRPCLCVSSKKVPTKMTFNRHLLVVSAESTFRRKSTLHSFRRSRVFQHFPSQHPSQLGKWRLILHCNVKAAMAGRKGDGNEITELSLYSRIF